MRASLLAVLALGIAQPGVAQQISDHRTAFHTQVLEHPCGTAGARFGESTVVLDMNGDGRQDVAVGAYGEGRVYVFYGGGNNSSRPSFVGQRLFDATGAILCQAPARADRFGFDVAAGDLDTDPADELVVGAPFDVVGGLADAGSVQVLGITGTTPVRLTAASPTAGARLGNSVIVGDFNHDGQRDVAAGARLAPVGGIAAGRVHVFLGPFDAGPPQEIVLENPNPVLYGNFGHHLAVGDADSDGDDDLYIASTGNTANSVPAAGQIFCFPGPLTTSGFVVIEDPNPDPTDLPAPRYGMHIAARAHWLMVGANRKDWGGVHDAGLGFVYPGPGFGSVTLHEFPGAQASDYMGFRCAIANVVGDASLDFTFVVMPNQHQTGSNPLALVTWDGTDLLGPPARIWTAIRNSADHFANGLTYGDLVQGSYEALVVGDPSFDAPGTGGQDNTGRVVVYF